MKPSFLIVAAATLFSMNGYAEEQRYDSRISQIEVTLQDYTNRMELMESQAVAHSERSTYQNSTNQYGSPPPKPADPNVVKHSAQGCMDKGFTLQADFLWWRANMDDLDYAFRFNDDAFLGGSPKARIKEPNFNYDPGFRVAAGYDFGRSNWDIVFAWTYHYTKATDSTGNAENIFSMVLTRLQTFDEGNYKILFGGTGRSSWRTRLNTFDFEMGYDHFYSKWYSTRTHFGIKAAWIDMEYNASYKNFFNTETGGLTPVEFVQGSLRSKSDFWAVGPRLGFENYLHIGWGFSLYGNIAGALMYGEYDLDARYFVERVLNTFLGRITDIPFSQEMSRLRAMAEMAVGLEWSYCFSGNYLLSFHIGWENQYWWNQLEARLVTDYQPNGDLTYSGLDVGVRFDF